MEVINYNANGRVIKDLSQISLPREMAQNVFNILNAKKADAPTSTGYENIHHNNSTGGQQNAD